MALDELHLKSGTWLAVNCASMPSDSNCQMLMMAPDNQSQDLLDAAVDHAVNKHGHVNNEELRASVADSIQSVEV